jgi:hypothetical protein
MTRVADQKMPWQSHQMSLQISQLNLTNQPCPVQIILACYSSNILRTASALECK